MAVLLGSVEVFLVAKNLVGIHQRLVHAAMLRAEHLLHQVVRDVAHHVDAPVAEPLEEFLGQGAACVEVSVAQACQYLVLAIERHPAARFAEFCDVASVESCPDVIQRLSADKALQPLRVVLVGILTVLHDVEAIIQLLFHLGLHIRIVRGCVGQGKRAHIVATYVTAEVKACIAAPVREVGVLLFPVVILRRAVLAQACLTDEWSHQSVCVILQQ